MRAANVPDLAGLIDATLATAVTEGSRDGKRDLAAIRADVEALAARFGPQRWVAW
jgi:hypothetical protein